MLKLLARLGYGNLILVICGFAMSFSVIKILPQFVLMFESFGAALPGMTILAINYHGLTMVPPLIAAVVNIIYALQGNSEYMSVKWPILALFILTLLLCVLSVVSLYLPVFPHEVA